MARPLRWRSSNRPAPSAETAPAEAPEAAEAPEGPSSVAVSEEPPTAPEVPDDRESPEDSDGFALGRLLPVALLRAAHPRQAVLTAFGLAVAAGFAGRPGREVLLVFATVLVGQTILGWANDLVDRRRDERHGRVGKPVAQGYLDPGTLWFSLAVAVLVVVPLSIGNGIDAGSAYLISLAVGLLGQWPALRRGFWSWLPWAVAFALYPAFLSYGGWGGQQHGDPPSIPMTVLAAVLGVGVHLLTALWGLVADNEDGWRYLPLKLGLRIGASKLLWVAVLWVVVVLAAIAWVGSSSGLTR